VLVPVPIAGSPKEMRRMKPVYPAKPKQPQWPLRRVIPAQDIAAIKRPRRGMLEACRRQRQA
jgi:hypothetical protein